VIDLAVLTFATEAWPAVFGGLIPVIGLAGVGYLVLRAVRDDGEDEE
jgi:hypothetical protein